MGKTQTETTQNKQTNFLEELGYSRGQQVTTEILTLEEGDTALIKITGNGLFKSRKYPEGILYFNVIDLKTGEEMRMWVDGGLKGAFSRLIGEDADLANLVDKAFEIKKGAQKPFTNDDGEQVRVNTYKIWELSPKTRN